MSTQIAVVGILMLSFNSPGSNYNSYISKEKNPQNLVTCNVLQQNNNKKLLNIHEFPQSKRKN